MQNTRRNESANDRARTAKNKVKWIRADEEHVAEPLVPSTPPKVIERSCAPWLVECRGPLSGVLTEDDSANDCKDIISHLKATVGRERSQDCDDARSEVLHKGGKGFVKNRLSVEAGCGTRDECLDRLEEDKTREELGDHGKECVKYKSCPASGACLAWDVQSTRPIPTMGTAGCNEVKGVHDG